MGSDADDNKESQGLGKMKVISPRITKKEVLLIEVQEDSIHGECQTSVMPRSPTQPAATLLWVKVHKDRKKKRSALRSPE